MPRENRTLGCPSRSDTNHHRRRLEALNFEFEKKRDCNVSVARTKALISCTADLHLCFRIGKNPFFSRGGLYGAISFLSVA